MPEGWTLDALKEHLESRIGGAEDAAKLALDAAERAADKADAAFEKRMDTTNEWRAALTDQQATFVTKEQVRWAFTAMLAGGALVTAVLVAINGSG